MSFDVDVEVPGHEVNMAPMPSDEMHRYYIILPPPPAHLQESSPSSIEPLSPPQPAHHRHYVFCTSGRDCQSRCQRCRSWPVAVIGGIDGCAAIFWNYAKLRTWTESWFEGECIHVWAIGHIAHESRLKIQCPQEIGKKATAAYFSIAVYSPTYTVDTVTIC